MHTPQDIDDAREYYSNATQPYSNPIASEVIVTQAQTTQHTVLNADEIRTHHPTPLTRWNYSISSATDV